ncbi:MAG: 23S rRNA (pseudouridine(1915)-N(3))-methyltransferase RlmH [Bacteroidota bacterium]
MKIKFICIGKTGKDFLIAGENEYLGRLKHYLSVERIEIPDLKNQSKLSFDQIKEAEGKDIFSKISPSDHVILLDENGKQFGSEEFAIFFQDKMNAGIKTMVVVVGGAFGFSSAMYERANAKISLSKMTFSHQMIRMIFFEQLYRAMTILKNEPYHHR